MRFVLGWVWLRDLQNHSDVINSKIAKLRNYALTLCKIEVSQEHNKHEIAIDFEDMEKDVDNGMMDTINRSARHKMRKIKKESMK